MTPHSMTILALALLATSASLGASESNPVVWYTHPADKWENALPLGNGRLGAMVFGRTDEEQIQLNEDTLWSGGPYSTTVRGGRGVARDPAADLRRAAGAGPRPVRPAPDGLPGRAAEVPVARQPGPELAGSGEVSGLPPRARPRHGRRDDDATRAEASASAARSSSAPVDQVIVVRLTADAPGAISFMAQLRGARNQAHSNYATDYFQMDGHGERRPRRPRQIGGLPRHRREAALRGAAQGGSFAEARCGSTTTVSSSTRRRRDAALAAATNFVSYKDVSADPAARVDAVMRAAAAKSFEAMRAAHVREHRRLFRRVS